MKTKRQRGKTHQRFGGKPTYRQTPKNQQYKRPAPRPTDERGNPVFPMRINKYLSWKKYATRSGADELITKGQVRINGHIARLGAQIEEKDIVEVNRKGQQKELVYYAYHKPRSVITHSPQHGEKEVRDLIPFKDVFPVGRLDKDSSGLLILTNDGRVTERLLHPRFEHEKEYVVTTKEKLRSNFKTKMEAGVKIEHETTKPCKVFPKDERTFAIVLTEGKKHQIRRMCSALFQHVDTLKRVRIMSVELGKLKEGELRKLEGTERERFLKDLDLL